MAHLFFSKHLQALVMSERHCFNLSAIVFCKEIVAIAACLDSVVVKVQRQFMIRQFSDSQACWQRVEKTWSIQMMEGAKYIF